MSLAHGTDHDFRAIEKMSGGKLGAFAIDTRTGASMGWRMDQRFPFCSSFKAPLAAFVLWKADRGQLALDGLVRYTAADLLPYAPVTRANLTTGAMPFSSLCEAAVGVSDNTAANLLLRETGGPGALTAWMRANGDTAFDLSANEPRLNLSRYDEHQNTSTPRAMAGSYCRLAVGDVLSPMSRKLLTDWLVGGTTGNKRIRAGLPSGWIAGDKTGTYDGNWFSAIDIAIAWPPGAAPYVIAAFLTDTPNVGLAERAIVEVARSVARWRMDLRR